MVIRSLSAYSKGSKGSKGSKSSENKSSFFDQPFYEAADAEDGGTETKETEDGEAGDEEIR